MAFALSKSGWRTPKIRRPTIMSHDPGVKGVTKATNPIITNMTPKTFLTFECAKNLFSLSFVLANLTKEI